MSIPDFQSIMRPLLELASDGKEHSISEVTELLAQRFKLTEEEKMTLLPSGRQATFRNRTAWAKSYLTQAGVLESSRRGFFKITERGHGLLKDSPSRITIKELEQFPEFVQFRSTKHVAEDTQPPEHGADKQTPEEMLESAYQRFRAELAAELLSRVKKASYGFFERLVVELLLKMGYGGSRKEAGEAIGRSGDEGIDGIINEDRLGLDVIYLQAKRWEGSVGRPEIQKFVGALHGKRAKKDVFITTSTFSSDAREYVTHIDPRVVLIDGEQLSELMINWNVGVSPVAAYETKQIDSDYFEE
jgi:restriction system protein